MTKKLKVLLIIGGAFIVSILLFVISFKYETNHTKKKDISISVENIKNINKIIKENEEIKSRINDLTKQVITTQKKLMNLKTLQEAKKQELKKNLNYIKNNLNKELKKIDKDWKIEQNIDILKDIQQNETNNHLDYKPKPTTIIKKDKKIIKEY